VEFSPKNSIVRLCLQGMDMEAEGNREEAGKLFLQAWNEATNDFEKYLAAYYLARQQTDVSAKLKWFETALQLALKTDTPATTSALPSIYSNIAECYESLNEIDSAKKYAQLATSARSNPSDNGPFYHGTKADLKTGDLLTAGFNSNYHSSVVMNHIYFTALANGAGLAAELAPGEGQARVYVVEPTGSFESDPNVTDKKFPGNPTRSYRSSAPLKIIGEVKDWVRLTPEELKRWREKLAKIESSKGKIVN
jgi:rifampin ADP-ribosylating transferase